jgi:hypothetical protein
MLPLVEGKVQNGRPTNPVQNQAWHLMCINTDLQHSLQSELKISVFLHRNELTS